MKKQADFYRNKTVVVYGANGGLGAAICGELCGRVARLVLAGRSAEKLNALERDLMPLCGPETLLEVWVTTNGMADFAARIQQNGADGLIVATGKTLYQRFCATVESSWQDYEELFQVNLLSVLQLAQVLLPYFRRQRGFFHIAGSYACLFPVPYQAVYSASKSALLFLVQAVAREQEAEYGRAKAQGLLSISLIGGMATNMYYQSCLHRQFAKWEKLVIAPPQKIAVGLLEGIARRKTIITIKLTGFLVYHVLRRAPAKWLSCILLRAYRPRKRNSCQN